MKFKKNNKGFSLVELIIVIAIMVALVAVLAPQFTKYVEKSRQAVDVSAVDGMLNACKTIAVDPDSYDKAKGGFTLTWATNGSVTANNDLQSAVDELIGSNVAPKSKDFAQVTITYASGAFTVAGPNYIQSSFTSGSSASPSPKTT